MENTSYFFEINDLVTSFIAAFDDTRIKRHDKGRTEKEVIDVRYVLAPKHRVMYDIVNKAQNITLPVVAVNITSIDRDKTRVMHKLEPTYLPAANNSNGRLTAKILPPVPIDIRLSMSILAKYQSDVDQIISNFVPYANPYIVLTWQLPAALGAGSIQEIRSEVLWDGSINLTEPTDTIYSDKFRIIADTSFTIKGWLFKAVSDPVKIIYKVTTDLHALDMRNKFYTIDDYSTLSAYNDNSTLYTDTICVSGIPTISTLFYTTSGANAPLRGTVAIKKSLENSFILHGKMLDHSNTFYLSSGVANFSAPFVQITTAKSPVISAYALPATYYNVIDNSLATVTIPANYLSAAGNFTLVTANSAGWGSTYAAASSILNLQ